MDNAARIAAAVDRGKREIRADLASGLVPKSVGSFAELHDHVDANGYGGAFEATAHDCGDTDYWNAVQDALDTWIKAGMA